MKGINIFYEFNGNKRNLYTECVDNNLDLYNQISAKEVSELVIDNYTQAF